MDSSLTEALHDVVFTTRLIVTNRTTLPHPAGIDRQHRQEWHPRIEDWWNACERAAAALDVAPRSPLYDQWATQARVSVRKIIDSYNRYGRDRVRDGCGPAADTMMAMLRNHGIPVRWDEGINELVDCIAAMESMPAHRRGRSVPMTQKQLCQLLNVGRTKLTKDGKTWGVKKAERASWTCDLDTITDGQFQQYECDRNAGLFRTGRRL